MKATLQLALEALERGETQLRWKAITAIKEALAQPEQEPVARLHITETDTYPDVDVEVLDGATLQPSMSPVNVYTTQPYAATPRQRKPLSEAQLEKGRDQTFSINNPFCPCDSKTFRKVARWVEAAHDIKE